MNYCGQNCPVCAEPFKEDDDVVVCPECGTPHHRECYKKNGKCFNASLHGDYVYNRPYGSDDTVEEMQNTAENTQTEEPKTEPGFFGQDAGGRAFPPFEPIGQNTVENTVIDGIRGDFYIAAIGKNFNYYVPRFLLMDRTNKEASWNFFAFLCPIAWSIYRKMYKLAALAFAISLVFTVINNVPYMFNKEYIAARDAVIEEAREDPSKAESFFSYISGKSGKLTEAQVEFLKVSEEVAASFPQAAYWAIMIGEWALRVFIGIFATKFYRKKLTAGIKKTSALNPGLDDGSFRMLLGRKFGTAPLIIAIFIGIFEAFAFFA